MLKIKIKGIVYLRTDPSGLVYVGQTINEKGRNADWLCMTQSYAGERINKAREKYHPSLWSYKVLYSISGCNRDLILEILDYFETVFIKKYNSLDPKYGYNMTEGGRDSYYNNSNIPIVIYDLYTKEKLYRFSSIGESFRHFGKYIIPYFKLNAKIKDNNSTLPVATLPGNKFALVYRENDFSEDILESDREKVIKITRYRKVIQIDPVTREIIKIWNNSDEVNKFYKINSKKDRSISVICRDFSKNNNSTFDGYIWMFYDEYLYKVENGLIDSIFKKNLNHSNPVATFDMNGYFSGIYPSMIEASNEKKKFSRPLNSSHACNTTLLKAMRRFRDYENALQLPSYGCFWIEVDILEEMINKYSNSISIKVEISGKNFYPYIKKDLEGNVIKRYNNVKEIIEEDTRLTQEYINGCVYNNRPIKGEYYLYRSTDNTITLDLEAARVALEDFKSKYIINV